MTSAISPPQAARTIRAMQVAMHALFVVLYTVGLSRALTESHGKVMFAIVGAAAAFLGIYLSGPVLERRVRTEADGRSRLPTLWILALVLGWFVLLSLNASFAWLAFALYFLILHVAPRLLAYALSLFVLLSSIVVLNLDGPSKGAPAVIGPVMGTLVALGIAWIYQQLRHENAERQHLVEELLAAQDDVWAIQQELSILQREAGTLAERARLARDIHDTLAQDFSSIVLLSRAGLARAEDALLRQIEEAAATGLRQSREVVHALAPQELVEAPLFSALERLGTRVEEQTGIEASCRVIGVQRALSSTLEVALLRIAQGALANVKTYSKAREVQLTLTYAPETISLEIFDDGVGFTEADIRQAPLSGSGFGLRAIRERVAALHGEVRIDSGPGQGSRILATLPTSGSTS